VGTDGLIIEVHNQPELARSDAAQSLTLEQYQQLINEVRMIHDVMSPIPAQ
jgi:3-deoxy-7-phosphoheptulonate synthase